MEKKCVECFARKTFYTFLLHSSLVEEYVEESEDRCN
jgi:hypothetical protein